MGYKKVYIKVIAECDDGKVTPLSVEWADGRVFEVDRVLDVRREASMNAGGLGIKYTVRIRGQQRVLYYDDYESRWFVEVKEGQGARNINRSKTGRSPENG